MIESTVNRDRRPAFPPPVPSRAGGEDTGWDSPSVSVPPLSVKFLVATGLATMKLSVPPGTSNRVVPLTATTKIGYSKSARNLTVYHRIWR